MDRVESRCDENPGRTVPVIDRNRCEAKSDCVDVCPYDVFEVRKLTPGERSGISLIGRLKLAGHRGRQAFVVDADACHACGLCVPACPEKAIKLVAAGTLA
jgi:4Fe-4S ferredoxin